MAAARTKTAAFPKPHHDHTSCAADALRVAETLCRERKSRLTDIRRQVLKMVWASHVPIGAYDILSRLNAGGGRVAPMAVYRALDFLMENGLVHRIASLNAFTGCALPGQHHLAQFLICHGCGNVAELESMEVKRALSRAVAERGFAVEGQIVEISGLCPHCQAS